MPLPNQTSSMDCRVGGSLLLVKSHVYLEEGRTVHRKCDSTRLKLPPPPSTRYRGKMDDADRAHAGIAGSFNIPLSWWEYLGKCKDECYWKKFVTILD